MVVEANNKNKWLEAAQEDRPLYDNSSQDDFYNVQINPDLDEQETEEALKYIYLRNGLMVVTGYMGAGKDLFGHTWTWKLRRYYNKTVFLDTPPRELFGKYIPFSEPILMRRLEKMGEEDKAFKRLSLTKQIDVWYEVEGEELFTNSVVYLQEFYKYMHNRSPFNPMNKLIGRMVKRFRHIDLLIIGTAPKLDELDIKACLDYITYEVRAKRSEANANQCIYRIVPLRYVSTKGVFNVTGQIKTLVIDGGASRQQLEGKRFFDLYNSKSKERGK